MAIQEKEAALAAPKGAQANGVQEKLSVNQRAQIEFNEIIARKLGEFKSMRSTRVATSKRETDYAIKIDNLTSQLKDQKELQQRHEELERENTIA